MAVYRSGTWYILGSTAGFTAYSFGNSTDIPAPADYDGDNKSDVAVFRPNDGTLVYASVQRQVLEQTHLDWMEINRYLHKINNHQKKRKELTLPLFFITTQFFFASKTLLTSLTQIF